jgi:hypothetical protein
MIMNKNRVLWIEIVRVLSVSSLLIAEFTGVAMAQNPVPLISEPLIPGAAKPGGTGVTLTVNGTGFVSGAVVHWNGSALATTFVSEAQLKASILASDIAKAGTASVTVANPAPGGGTSNSVSFPVTPASTSFSFSGANYTVGTSPWDVAVGDFNGDGKLDLAVTNNADSTVSILVGSGDGSFKALATVATGQSPQGITAADFNGDGKLDLAIANDGSGTVSILLGKGDGTFVRQDYSTGQGPQTVAVADFNGDGKLDLAVANYGDSTVSILLGNGDGTFQPQVAYPAGVNPIGALVGDFNRDGKLDLAVPDNNAPFGISILLGNGDGSFGSPVLYPAGTNPRVGMVADFNADGKLDLAIANYSDSDVSILFGNGDGSFQAPVNYSVGGSPTDLRGADFNGDGKLDLVTANQTTNSMSVLLGNGDGTFQAHVDYPTGSGPQDMAVGDFNADGRLDVALADNTGATVSLILQGPSDSLSETSLTFGAQVVGTSSATQMVTLTNTGILTLTVSSIAVTGTNETDFNQTNTCGAALAPGGECTIAVSFDPTQPGPRSGSVTITDNAAGTPQVIAVSGSGVLSGPNATLSATSLTFATEPLGITSGMQSITLTDFGTATLKIASIVVAGADRSDFAQTNNCGSALAPGASCIINVTFSPTQAGSRTANLSISDNSSGSPQTVSLAGTGTVIQLNPVSLSFGYVSGGQSRTLTTTLTNRGSAALGISSIRIAGTDADEFHQGNNCGSSLGPGASCTISVTFRPTDLGLDSAYISISDTGSGSPQQVSLKGGLLLHGL